MSQKPTLASPSDSESWLISPEDAALPLSLVVQQRQLTSVFPYMRFVWAEGSANEVEIYFATHVVTVIGHGLALLLAAVAEHRLVRLTEPTQNEATFAGSAGAVITAISIHGAEKPENKGNK